MKLKDTFVVELESPDGSAFFTFEETPLNKGLEESERLNKLPDGTEKLKELNKSALRNLIKVEGLEGSDGEAITVEDVKELNVPGSFIGALCKAIIAHRTGEKDPEKNG